MRSPPPSNARLAAPVPIHPTSGYSDERKHNDDQMLVRRYYEHREQPAMPLPSLSQTLPPYQPPHLPHSHEPSPYYRSGNLHDEKFDRARNQPAPHREENPYYDQNDRKNLRRSPPYQSDRNAHMQSPRDRYGYNYPPPQENQQYDRLAWRDEGPWLRVSDNNNNSQHHQQQQQQQPQPPPSQHHHSSYSFSNETSSHGHRASLQSPSSGSAASSPPNEHHHLPNEQDSRHPRLIRASGNGPADSKAPSYPFRLPLGKTVHHTRRKKRDTKPPNANELRTIVELEKDEHGNYKLPVEVDSWTVISLGKVIWDKPAFHNQRYIYPVGYVVKK